MNIGCPYPIDRNIQIPITTYETQMDTNRALKPETDEENVFENKSTFERKKKAHCGE